MNAPADLRLALSSENESLAIVQAALSATCTAFALDPVERDAVEMAVCEACKNVVVHAYEGGVGPLELELRARSGAIEVSVRDRGIGIRPHLGERTRPHTGLGMPIVHLNSRRVSYTNLPGGGTEVLMEFELPDLAPPPSPPVAPEAVAEMPVCERALVFVGRLLAADVVPAVLQIADDRLVPLTLLAGPLTPAAAAELLHQASDALGASRRRLAAEQSAHGEGRLLRLALG